MVECYLILTATRVKTCDKAVDNYLQALISVPNCNKIQKICTKDVSIYPSTIKFVADQFKTQEICDKAMILFLIEA